MTAPLLEVVDVSVTYDDSFTALAGATFTVRTGEVVAVVGPNGAGKSTLFKAMAGFVDHRGDIVIHGRHCHHLERQSIAYIPQHSDIDIRFPISVAEVVMAGRRRFHSRRMRVTADDTAHVMACLAHVDLQGMEKRSLSTLSGGQMQRVFIARALAQEADVLLLDEALSGVDAVHTDELISLFHDLAAGGTSILVSTHDLALVRQRFARCLTINRRLLGDGHPDEALGSSRIEELFASTTPGVEP